MASTVPTWKGYNDEWGITTDPWFPGYCHFLDKMKKNQFQQWKEVIKLSLAREQIQLYGKSDRILWFTSGQHLPKK